MAVVLKVLFVIVAAAAGLYVGCFAAVLLTYEACRFFGPAAVQGGWVFCFFTAPVGAIIGGIAFGRIAVDFWGDGA